MRPSNRQSASASHPIIITILCIITRILIHVLPNFHKKVENLCTCVSIYAEFEKKVHWMSICFHCRKVCRHSTYCNLKANEINSDCEFGKTIVDVCAKCGHKNGCRSEGIGMCVEYRLSEQKDMVGKSDAEILKYLEYYPVSPCPHRIRDIKKLAHEIAKDAWYDTCHTSSAWKNFAQDSNITKTEEEFIEQDILPMYMEQAQSIFAKASMENAPLNILKLGEQTNSCVNCPDYARCNNGLPGGWVGFPDLYLAEAMRRKIVAKVQDR